MCKINEVEVRREIMSVIEPMEMVKIRFVDEWVSPAGHKNKIKKEISGMRS